MAVRLQLTMHSLLIFTSQGLVIGPRPVGPKGEAGKDLSSVTCQHLAARKWTCEHTAVNQILFHTATTHKGNADDFTKTHTHTTFTLFAEKCTDIQKISET